MLIHFNNSNEFMNYTNDLVVNNFVKIELLNI